MKDKLRELIGIVMLGVAAGAVIEGLHWAFFAPKSIAAWITVIVAAAVLIKWLHWEIYSREYGPSQDEKDRADAWGDA